MESNAEQIANSRLCRIKESGAELQISMSGGKMNRLTIYKISFSESIECPQPTNPDCVSL